MTNKRSKFQQRLLSLLMVLAILFSMTACVTVPDGTQGSTQLSGSNPSSSTQIPHTSSTMTQPTTVPSEPSQPSTPVTTVPEQPVDPDALVYTLTEEDVQIFYTLLQECEELALVGEDMEAIEEANTNLDESYAYLNAQCSIAMILHYSHTKNAELEKQYLDCVEICTKANDAYIQMARNVYLSDTPAKDALFEGWTEEDIADLLAYDEEIAKIQQRNAEIGVEYRATTSDANKINLYIEFVQNNNRIAQFYGYENYYYYAYEKVYERDYDMAALAKMRQYAKDYLAKVFPNAMMNFVHSFNQEATYADRLAVQNFLFNDYTTVGTDYVGMYIESLPEDFAQIMNNMLEHDSLFTSAEDAMPGAFTTAIGDRSYCYFGPGYAVSSTVIHEGGHYYASRFTDLNGIPLDLAEVHSQGNEWLFISFLQDKMPQKQHNALVDYLLYEDIAMTLICLMVDEFEQRVYSTDLTGFTAANFDAIMNEVSKSYYPNGSVKDDLADMNYYWRQVVVDQPVYYISYAISGVTAMSLYTVAQKDYTHAMEIYQKLCEEPVIEAGFLGNIKAAGLYTPFDKKFYQDLEALIQSRG